MSDIALLHATFADAAEAERIGQAMVEAQLAACVNLLGPCTSIYRWQGAVEQADEVLLLAKAPAERLPALVERVRSLHPYELPGIVAVEAGAGLPAYLDWVAEATRE